MLYENPFSAAAVRALYLWYIMQLRGMKHVLPEQGMDILRSLWLLKKRKEEVGGRKEELRYALRA